MKYLLIFSLSLILSCSKNSQSMDTRPLKAIPSYMVNGKQITLIADKSEGDVCAYGWQMSQGSVAGGTATFSPLSSVQGEKNPDRNIQGQPYYKSGTLQYSPIIATVNKVGTYIFTLQVLDAYQKESIADITVEVK